MNQNELFVLVFGLILYWKIDKYKNCFEWKLFKNATSKPPLAIGPFVGINKTKDEYLRHIYDWILILKFNSIR